MNAITELDLPELDIQSQEFADDPYAFYGPAREQHWLAKAPAGYAVLGFEEMKELLAMDDVLSTPNQMITQLMGAEGTSWGEWNNNFLLAESGDDHKRIRGLVAPAFTPRSANLQRPAAREEIIKLLDEWAPKGRFDFQEFASWFPITVMCRLIGAPTGPVAQIKHSLEVQGAGFSLDPSILPALNEAIDFMWDYTHDLLEQRRAKEPPVEEDRDLLDDLLDAADQEGGLSERELHYLIMLLFGGGYDTSKNLLTMIMYFMLDRPEIWERLANDADYAKKVIEETLRFTNVVTTFRVAKQDVNYKDVLIPAGTPLIFPIPLAGRDPSIFAEADSFDPDRKAEQRHIAFGRGIHLCLGQFLARMQIEEALPLIARRLKNPRLDGDIEWRPFPGVWGLKSLPIAFEVE